MASISKDVKAEAAEEELLSEEEAVKARLASFTPDVPAPPAAQFSYQERATRLREKVLECAKSVYALPAAGQPLLEANVTKRFDLENGPPKACVEIDLKIENSAGKAWHVSMDADKREGGARPQNGHYGYTVYTKPSTIAKTSGHIWFPDGIDPLNSRPWVGESKGDKVVIGTQTQNGYTLSGYMFNQNKA